MLILGKVEHTIKGDIFPALVFLSKFVYLHLSHTNTFCPFMLLYLYPEHLTLLNFNLYIHFVYCLVPPIECKLHEGKDFICFVRCYDYPRTLKSPWHIVGSQYVDWIHGGEVYFFKNSNMSVFGSNFISECCACYQSGHRRQYKHP